MNVKELISKLEKQDPESTISIPILANYNTKIKEGIQSCNMASDIVIRKNEVFSILELGVAND